MSNIVNNYQRILEVIEPVYQSYVPVVKPGAKPKMTDIQVVAIVLTAEYTSIDSENHLFERLKGCSIDNLLERSRFNKRRRKLFDLIERIGGSLSQKVY